MKTMFKLLAVLALALSALAVSAPAALAASPTNDTFAGATLVAIGFSAVLDTTGGVIADGGATPMGQRST